MLVVVRLVFVGLSDIVFLYVYIYWDIFVIGILLLYCWRSFLRGSVGLRIFVC
jgi:hypothetical protein